MWTLNLFISSLFDFLFAPFANMNNFWGMAFISILAGVVMIFVYKYTSNQEGIRRSKNRIKAFFLEIRLFGDDWKAMIDSQKNIFLSNLSYMKYALIPLCFIIIPVILIMIQLNLRYGYEPLKVGEQAVVAVKLDTSTDVRYSSIKLSVPDGVVVDAPEIRIKAINEIDWQVKVEKPGIYYLEFDLDGKKFTKKLLASNEITRFSPIKSKVTIYEAFMNPSEEPLPKDGKIDFISINYKPAKMKIFSFKLHWIIVFFVLSLIAGFGMKGFFGVEV
jgi:uncharacterized membrane protein (DUF106 family)